MTRSWARQMVRAVDSPSKVAARPTCVEATRARPRHVIMHSDSEYAIGIVSQNWKVRANKQLVEHARALSATFTHLRFEWIPGHAGTKDDERCDELARAAIERARASRLGPRPGAEEGRSRRDE